MKNTPNFFSDSSIETVTDIKEKIAESNDLNKIINFLTKPEIDNMFVYPLSSRWLSINERVVNKFNEWTWVILLDCLNVIWCRAIIPFENDKVMLSTFAVDPKYQWKWLWKILYQYSIDVAIKKYNPKEIYVDSWNTNSVAFSLAKKFGFEKILNWVDFEEE